MSHAPAQLRRTGRITVLTAALSLALAGGLASTASATGSNGPLNKPQPISKADANPGGANGQCPEGPYCSTRDGSVSLNGNGNGNAVGKPAAGAVGKADNKNPRGQMPDGSDLNAGYECDTNHGIGRSNPAHTACIVVKPVVTPVVPPVVPPGVTPVVPPGVTPVVPGVTPVVPPVVTPVVPPVVPPVVVAPVVVAPVAPSVLGTSAELTPSALGVVAEAPVVVPSAGATNPLPAAAAAGLASTGDQLAVGGFAAFAALLAFGAAFVLRRRHGVI